MAKCHPREGGDPVNLASLSYRWIPTFVGMTEKRHSATVP